MMYYKLTCIRNDNDADVVARDMGFVDAADYVDPLIGAYYDFDGVEHAQPDDVTVMGAGVIPIVCVVFDYVWPTECYAIFTNDGVFIDVNDFVVATR